MENDVAIDLAPMAGVSESPFRQICRRFGADVVVSEFISSVGISLGIERVLAEMRFEPVERPIGIQIYGADATIMARAAGMVTELFEPDFVDINFGCPVKKVVRNNGGSGSPTETRLVRCRTPPAPVPTHPPPRPQRPHARRTFQYGARACAACVAGAGRHAEDGARVPKAFWLVHERAARWIRAPAAPVCHRVHGRSGADLRGLPGAARAHCGVNFER